MPTTEVTDSELLKELQRQGINKDDVEFTQDYALPSIINGKKEKEKSPYAKFYRDTKSNKRFMVVSRLPMVNHAGQRVQVGWDYIDGVYHSKVNQFDASVDGTQVTIACINDQADGRKIGDSLRYAPQLFLDDVEQVPKTAVLLTTDPVNPNYSQNTIEWDYGICKRRLRLIEGSVLGYWVFPANPHGNVRIKYNQMGKSKLRLGQFQINEDEEFIPEDVFDNPSIDYDFLDPNYPLTIHDSDTFYPDADPESTSVDGYVRYYTTGYGLYWTSIRNTGAGTNAYSNLSYATVASLISGTADPHYYAKGLYRGFFLFDTSALPDDADISAAVISLYPASYTNNSAAWTGNINIYSSSPASNTNLVVGDYDEVGTTAYCDTPISDSDWEDAVDVEYLDFALNSTGLAAISKTGVTKLGTKWTFDADDNPPAYEYVKNMSLAAYCAEQGAGYKPKLVVTYGGEPVTTTIALDALLEKLGISHLLDADAALMATGIGQQDIDLMLKLSASSGISFDTLLKLSLQREGSLDALLLIAKINSFGIDAALGKIDESATLALDVMLQLLSTAGLSIDSLIEKLGVEKKIVFDILINRLLETGITLDSIFQKTGIQSSFIIDAAIKEFGITQAAEIDALFTRINTDTVSTDTLLKELGISTGMTIDILFKLLAERQLKTDALFGITPTKGISIDILLERLEASASFVSDVLIKVVLEEGIAIDTILQLLGSAELSVDSYIKKTGIEREIILDAILKTLFESGLTIDSIIQGLGLPSELALDALFHRTELTTGVLIDVFLGIAFGKQIKLDALLKGVGLSASLISDALIRTVINKGFAIDLIISRIGEQGVWLDSLLKLTDRDTTFSMDVKLIGLPSVLTLPATDIMEES